MWKGTVAIAMRVRGSNALRTALGCVRVEEAETSRPHNDLGDDDDDDLVWVSRLEVGDVLC
jgi:hypothetical protein